MKKLFKIMAVIILSLLIFFAGIFKYRQYQANQVLIPLNAEAMIKINVDEVLKSLAASMITNPVFYLKSGNKKMPEEGKTKLSSGLKLPASLYGYILQNQPKTAMFSRVEISQIKDFETFLKHTLGFKIVKRQNAVNFASSGLGNVVICYNSKAAAIAISGENKNFDSVLNSILKLENCVKLGDSKFNQLKDLTNHIVCINNQNSFMIDFEDGEIDFHADMLNKSIIPATKPQHRQFNKESTASIWLNARFLKAANKTYRFKGITIERDSLLKYYKGYLDFEWTNSVLQTDSVITYGYNDDFEKIEKVTLQKREVPNFTLSIASDAKGLENYLNQQKIISPDRVMVNKSVFPLYQVFAGGDDRQLRFATNKNIKVSKHIMQSNEFFSLDVNFGKLNAQINLAGVNRYLKSFNKLEVKGKSINPHQIRLGGKLTLNNSKINSLGQLLKDF